MPRILRGTPAFLLAAVLASCLMVSGCGQNGPLFLPDDQLSKTESETENNEEQKEESTE
jgi:predicted small lipoprotein YifL